MPSRGKNILIGCGIGCAGALFVFVIALIGFFAWLGRPGELLEPERLLGDDTGGFIELTLRTEDPGMERLLEAWVEHNQQLAEEEGADLHPIFRTLITSKQRRDARKLRELFPIVVAWTMSHGERTEDDLHLITLSLKKMGNRLRLVDMVLGLSLRWSPDFESIKHRGETIYELPVDKGARGAIFIRGNDVFYTTDVETARRAVDRLIDPAAPTGHPSTELVLAFDEVPADHALRGALTNRQGQLLDLLQGWGGHELDGVWRVDRWDGLEALTLWGGFVDDSAFEGRAELRSREAWTTAQAEALQQALESRAAAADLSMDIRVSPLNDRLRIDYRLNELTSLLDELDN
jgi:hypothetical protein